MRNNRFALKSVAETLSCLTLSLLGNFVCFLSSVDFVFQN